MIGICKRGAFRAPILFLFGITLVLVSCKEDGFGILYSEITHWNYSSTYGYQTGIERYILIEGKEIPEKYPGEYVYFSIRFDSTTITSKIRQIRPLIVRGDPNANKYDYTKRGGTRSYKNQFNIQISDSILIDQDIKLSSEVLGSEGPDSFYLYYIGLEIMFDNDPNWWGIGLLRRDMSPSTNGGFFVSQKTSKVLK